MLHQLQLAYLGIQVPDPSALTPFFGEVIRHGGSYRAAFLALAILPLAAGISMVRKGKKPSPRG